MTIAAKPIRKTQPGAPQFVGRAAAFKQIGGDGDRTFQFLASDDSIDRVGDTIDPAGWDCEAFKQNPVVLYAHDQQSIPVGQVTKIWADEKGLHAQIRVDDITDLDKTVFAKLKAGTLRAVSVGFRPIEWEWADRKDEATGESSLGIDYKRQELLELTICPVPANASALAEERTKSMATGKSDGGEMADHVKTLGEHVKAFGEHLEKLKSVIGADAVDDGDAKGFEARVTKSLAAVGLTGSTLASAVKAAVAEHVMHPEVAKCVKSAHVQLSKAIALHNAGQGAIAGGEPDEGADEGGDGDEDDKKALALVEANQKRINELMAQATGRIS